MGATSSYKSLDIYITSKKLVMACYALAHDLPPEEKTNLSFYLRNAALTAHLAISQGVFLKKNKARQKFLSKALNAFIVIDAVVDVLVEAGMVKEENTTEVMRLCSACYQQIEGLLKKNKSS